MDLIIFMKKTIFYPLWTCRTTQNLRPDFGKIFNFDSTYGTKTIRLNFDKYGLVWANFWTFHASSYSVAAL